MNKVTVVPLEWADDPLGTVDFPAKQLVLRHGIGSGLSADPHESGVVWALADRGPNLEVHTAVDHYGWAAPETVADNKDAKLMPRLDVGPYLARLRLTGTSVELDRTVRLTTSGTPVPGVPLPESDHHQCEPAYDGEGRPLDPDPAGMDTEGLAALGDGGFWLGEEYGPSLIELDASAQVRRRILPVGRELESAPFPVECSLPALAARRHLNRGFEAVATSPSEDRLFLAFQSPLSHPDKSAFEKARHVRIWELDRDARVLGQYLYPFDSPHTFKRDAAQRELGWKDLKVCEIAAIGERSLLVLERSMETSKIYRVDLDERLRTPEKHLDVDTRPTIEELSAGAQFELPVLAKTLLFSSDDHPEVTADMEGLAPLSERSLLLVSDNDFGVEDKQTRFFRLDFADPFTG